MDTWLMFHFPLVAGKCYCTAVSNAVRHVTADMPGHFQKMLDAVGNLMLSFRLSASHTVKACA